MHPRPGGADCRHNIQLRIDELSTALARHPAGCFRLTFTGGARHRVRDLRRVNKVAAFLFVDEVEPHPGIWGITATRFAAVEAIAALDPLEEAECQPSRRAGAPSGCSAAATAPLLVPPYGLFGLAALALLLFAVELSVFSLAGPLLRASGGHWMRALLQLAPLPLAEALAAAWAFRRRPVYLRLNRFRPRWRVLALAAATGVAFTLALQLVTQGVSAPVRSPLLVRYGVAAIIINLFAILPNELLERGVLLSSLLAFMPAWPAMLLGAEAVALLRGSPLGALPLQFAAAIVYRKAGNSLPAAIAFRVANDLTFLALPLLLLHHA